MWCDSFVVCFGCYNCCSGLGMCWVGNWLVGLMQYEYIWYL